jgi:hypothetical protein
MIFSQPETHLLQPLARSERRIVCWLCLLAAIHVLVFSAAFPFFNNVDEKAHFDLVLRYTQGEIPRTVKPISDETRRYVALYDAQFFMGDPQDTGTAELLPPPWELPPDQAALWVSIKNSAAKEFNYENSQPPLYYTVAGAWWRLGGWLGFADGHRLYWLRFLNMPIMMLLVWLAWRTAGKIFTDDLFLRLGVPTLIAFLPQSTFYSVQNDVLSPLCFGVSFLLLLKLWESPLPPLPLAALTGLALAATFLTKMTNLPLLAVAGIFLVIKNFRLFLAGSLRPSLPPLAVLSLCAGLPMAAWMAWCQIHFGDITGAKPKIGFLGWTVKPVSTWLDHPLFTPHGTWIFLSKLLARFWQGEISKHWAPLAIPAANDFYTVMTLGLLAISVVLLLRHPQRYPAPQRLALWFAFGLFASAVAFLGFLSIIYDFHQCYYPSRELPYFTSGRLMLGALIPFSLVFVFGFGRVLDLLKLGLRGKCIWFGAFLLTMLAIEIVTDRAAFGDVYNWFHM